jgi:hypothetical protein
LFSDNIYDTISHHKKGLMKMVYYNKEWENPLFWFDKLLKYSNHAELRSFERDLPLIDFLSLDSKFLFSTRKKDVYSMTFETTVKGKRMEIAINSLGAVMTVYPVINSTADKFQFKYGQYLGAFKQPDNYMSPIITEFDFNDVDMEFIR